MECQKFFVPGRYGNIFALFSGALLTLAFAPYNIYPLAIICPALLLGLFLNLTPKQAFWRGLLFGLGFFGTGVSWVYVSIHTFGDAPILLAAFITIVFALILALFTACNGYLLNRYFPENTAYKNALAFPAIWVFLEWIRSWFFTGFPWLFLGYSQIDTAMRGYAPLFSVYGVSLIVVMCSGLIVNMILFFRKKSFAFFCSQIFFFVALWLIGLGCSYISWTNVDGKPIKISLVQGNIPQSVKWSPNQLVPTLKVYHDLTQKHWDSAIIIWPESAIPAPRQYVDDFLSAIAYEAKSHHSTIITGIPLSAVDKPGYYNAIITLGEGNGVYYKRLLVPFGEYVPMARFFQRILNVLNFPMSDFIPGNFRPQPLSAAGIKIAGYICYEIAYPEQVLLYNNGAGLILTISNDAWFGHSIAQAQHLQIARMRALEMGRPSLFVSNNGITAAIYPNGKIQSAIAPYTTDVLTETIQPMKNKTLWQRFGMDLILLVMIIFVVVARTRRQ